MDPRSEEKMGRLEQALARGVAFVHLDARRPGVVVPVRFSQDHQLKLKLSYRFDPPDLAVTEWGIRETLSFSGSRFAVSVPWSAIFAITGMQRNDEAWLYPDDMPRELFEAAARHFGLTGEEVARLREEASQIDQLDFTPSSLPWQPAKSGLHVVEKPPPSAAEPGTDDAEPGRDKPKRSHLRLIK